MSKQLQGDFYTAGRGLCHEVYNRLVESLSCHPDNGRNYTCHKKINTSNSNVIKKRIVDVV